MRQIVELVGSARQGCNMNEIDKFADEVYDFTVNEMGWKKDWSNGGCYIHLEASEFIESLRCKGDPVDELGDLLMCIFSVCRNYNIKPSDAIKKSRIKMAGVVANKEKYLIKSSKHI